MVMDSFNLDVNELNAQCEEESLMPAVLVGSEIKEVQLTDRDTGGTIFRKVWELKWERLDMDLSGPNGTFQYQSSHWMPDSNRPVTNRRNMQYAKQIECFAKLGVKGTTPEDFLDQKHWIKETSERNTGRPWWKSEAIYIDGQTYEEAIGGSSVDINPPSDSVRTAESTEELTAEASVYDLLVDTIN